MASLKLESPSGFRSFLLHLDLVPGSVSQNIQSTKGPGYAKHEAPGVDHRISPESLPGETYWRPSLHQR